MRIPESPAWAMQSAANPSEASANHASQERKLHSIFGSSGPIDPRSPASKDLKRCFFYSSLSHSSKVVLSVQRFEEVFFIQPRPIRPRSSSQSKDLTRCFVHSGSSHPSKAVLSVQGFDEMFLFIQARPIRPRSSSPSKKDVFSRRVPFVRGRPLSPRI